MHLGWQLGVPQLGSFGDVPRRPSNGDPESLDEGAFREYMVDCFISAFAELAKRVVDDVLAEQGGAAMDSPLGEQPAEELYPWGRKVLPHEAVGGVVMIPAHGRFVDKPGDELVVGALKEAGAVIRVKPERDVAQEVAEEIQLALCLGGEPVPEKVACASVHDVVH